MTAISSTFESQEPFLADLLKDIGAGELQLPDFQRPWVWDDVHIRSILASVSQAYPIGAVMILETGGDGVRFRPRVVEGVQLPEPVEPKKLILDGQQRLTSLYGALSSGRPVETRDVKQNPLKRFYYLDIEKALDPDEDRYDAILSVPDSRLIKSDFGRRIDLDLTSQEKEFELGMVPMGLLLSDDFAGWRIGYMKHFNMDAERVEKAIQLEQEIWMRFRQFKIPVIQLLKDTPKEAVCQVFEKVNTGGVALTVFELMTATFAADDFPLREDWETRRDNLSGIDVLNGVGGTDFLQAVTLLASYRRFKSGGKAVSVKRKDVLRLTLEEYIACANPIEEGFVKAARLLNRESIFDQKNLPYGTQLIPLAATCAQIGDRFEEENVRQKLARWYWCGVFGEMFGGANESRYAIDIQDLCGWILEDGPLPRTANDASFSPTRLLGLKTRLSAAYKGIMALMVKAGCLDFMNGDPIAHTQGFSLPVDIHHIFPKAWCRKQGIEESKWNCIVNKTPLTGKTNRILSGDAPSVYLERLVDKGTITAISLDENVIPTHLINPAELRADDFEKFLLTRASVLLDHIEQAMGRAISGRDSEEVTMQFGGTV